MDTLSVTETAKRLGFKSRTSVLLAMDSGLLCGFQDDKGRWRITLASVEAYKPPKLGRRPTGKAKYRSKALLPPGYITTKKAARLLKVSMQCIRTLIYRKQIAAQRINGGKNWMVREADLAVAKIGEQVNGHKHPTGGRPRKAREE